MVINYTLFGAFNMLYSFYLPTKKKKGHNLLWSCAIALIVNAIVYLFGNSVRYYLFWKELVLVSVLK